MPLADVHPAHLGKYSKGMTGPESAQAVAEEIVRGVLTVASKEPGAIGWESIANATGEGKIAVYWLGDASRIVGGALGKSGVGPLRFEMRSAVGPCLSGIPVKPVLDR